MELTGSMLSTFVHFFSDSVTVASIHRFDTPTVHLSSFYEMVLVTVAAGFISLLVKFTFLSTGSPVLQY